MKKKKIYLTPHDAEQLQTILNESATTETAAALEEELDRAVVVPPEKIGATVITMNSRVKYEDHETGQLHDLVLVYPKDADIAARKVSVLAPVGVALLGESKGQTIECRLPGGRLKRVRIVDVEGERACTSRR